MRNWDLATIPVEPHAPQVLSTSADARSIVLRLPAGEKLQEHSVHEHTRLVVIAGEIEVRAPDGTPTPAGPGHLFEFEPGERRTVAARAHSEALLLLVLSPWPGPGHPSA